MITHELVVLPLAAGQQPGIRTVGSDRTVQEAGSLGEASASCTTGAGDGITAGSTSWVTVHLLAGRYKLVCNLLGHYTAGMYAELDVTSPVQPQKDAFWLSGTNIVVCRLSSAGAGGRHWQLNRRLQRDLVPARRADHRIGRGPPTLVRVRHAS